ncbi:MAG: PIG-L family deacetylase [Anaerolineae bacterium]
MAKSILACFAHPDDELSCGPLISLYAAQGVTTTLICTTDGDVGTVDAKHMNGYNSIRDLRLAELQCATSLLGFSEVVTFNYRDSGMMGSPDNAHPDSSWQIPLETMTARVVEVMRRTRPQVVITFNEYGGYGHPDHIKINQATVAAFQQLQSEPYHPQKLYYTSGPRLFSQVSLLLMKLTGRDPRKSGKNKDVDLVAAVEASAPPTTRIAARKYAELSLQAARCHASQLPSIPDNIFARTLGSFFFGSVALERVYPPPDRGAPLERDVFENVTVD